MINTHVYLNYLEQLSYVGLFLFVVFSGYLIPIPEEIMLLLLGYIAGVGIINIYTALAAGILGVLALVAIYVPLLVFLGYHFHNKLVLVISGVEIVRHLIFFIFLAVVGSLITIFVKKKFLIKNKVK